MLSSDGGPPRMYDKFRWLLGLSVRELERNSLDFRAARPVERRFAYLRSFDEDDELGPACMPAAPPTATVSGVAFSSERSGRRWNSFSLLDGRCVVPFVAGGLFSTFTLTLSRHSNFKSGLAEARFASVDEVDEDDEAGLPSEIDASERRVVADDREQLTRQVRIVMSTSRRCVRRRRRVT